MRIRTLLFVIATLAGCSRSSSEPADTRELPPGVGPGAIGSRILLDPILEKHCPDLSEVTTAHNYDPRLWGDGPDPTGRPHGRSIEHTLDCRRRDRWDFKVAVKYHKLDAPDGWKDPVYVMYFMAPRDELLDTIKLFAGPFLSHEAHRTLDRVVAATFKGELPNSHTWFLDDRLRFEVGLDHRKENPLASANLMGNFKGAAGDPYPPSTP